jgi:gliding motility-associated transport system permease protein
VRGLVNTAAIYRREMAAYFLSPIAYVVICLFLLANGAVFYFSLKAFKGLPQEINSIIGALLAWAPYWSIVLPPVITMRLIAEEKRNGTIETLMTAPVTPTQVVAGKFLAAETFFVLVWLTLLLHVAILSVLGNPDLGPVIAGYIGLAALGLLMCGLGILASALTRNQVVAAVVSLIGGMLLMFLGELRRLFPGETDADRFFDFLGIPVHFAQEYARGILDLRFIAFYVLLAAVLLFFAVRLLEARAWK